MSHDYTYDGSITFPEGNAARLLDILDPDRAGDAPATADAAADAFVAATELDEDSVEVHTVDGEVFLVLYGTARDCGCFEEALSRLAAHVSARIACVSADGGHWLMLVHDGVFHDLAGRLVYEGEQEIIEAAAVAH